MSNRKTGVALRVNAENEGGQYISLKKKRGGRKPPLSSKKERESISCGGKWTIFVVPSTRGKQTTPFRSVVRRKTPTSVTGHAQQKGFVLKSEGPTSMGEKKHLYHNQWMEKA